MPTYAPRLRHYRLVGQACLTVLLAWLGSTPAQASFENGLAAYNRAEYQQAFRAWQPAAKAGDPNAQYALGSLYARGQGVARDQQLATRWYHAAATNGQLDAQYRMAIRYQTGAGLEKDAGRALTWYRIAAKSGHPKAKAAAKRLSKRMTPAELAAAQKLRLHGERTEVRVAQDSPLSESRSVVRQVQAYLRLLGYDPGAVDGMRGGATIEALKAFQRDAGLAPDGRPTPQALRILKQAMGAGQNVSPAVPSTSGTQ